MQSTENAVPRPLLYGQYQATTPFELSVAACMDVLSITPIDINSIFEPEGYEDEGKYRLIARSLWASSTGATLKALTDREWVTPHLDEVRVLDASASMTARILRTLEVEGGFAWPRRYWLGTVRDVEALVRVLLAIEDRESPGGAPALITPLILQVFQRSSELESAMDRIARTARLERTDLTLLTRFWFPNFFGEVLIKAATPAPGILAGC